MWLPRGISFAAAAAEEICVTQHESPPGRDGRKCDDAVEADAASIMPRSITGDIFPRDHAAQMPRALARFLGHVGGLFLVPSIGDHLGGDIFGAAAVHEFLAGPGDALLAGLEVIHDAIQGR